MQASARLSAAASRKVIAGVSSATTRSCYQTSRGKAHAALVPAQELPPKGRKRITLQERRVRIAEFVENYRASNNGKFPTVKNTHRQVGGSYYTVRLALQEIVYNHAKSPLGNVKPAPLPETVEVIENPMLEDRVVENQGVLEGKVEFPEHPGPKDASGKTATHDMDTSVTCKTADAPALSDQTEGVTMKDPTDKPDPGNQQREIEANKFDLKNLEKSLNANDSNASDQSGSHIVNEAKTNARNDNPKHEESANTGLLGSLKSFAYGIRNFWKNM